MNKNLPTYNLIINDTDEELGIDKMSFVERPAVEVNFLKFENAKLTFQDEEKRTKAERLCMLASKSFIMNREELKTGKDFLEVIKQTTVRL